jgi:hypothetical protein
MNCIVSGRPGYKIFFIKWKIIRNYSKSFFLEVKNFLWRHEEDKNFALAFIQTKDAEISRGFIRLFPSNNLDLGFWGLKA